MRVRLATQEEIESIRDRANLTPTCSIYAYDPQTPDGKPDFAVFRMTPELDPAIFAEDSSLRRRATFIWALENGLRMTGSVPFYCFNVRATDQEMIDAALANGSEQLSPEPFHRFIKKLN